jgi:hypothetical protein
VSFVHDDPDFVQVLRFVSDETRIDPSLVEKDYWVTHCMWALHQTGLELWLRVAPASRRATASSGASPKIST